MADEAQQDCPEVRCEECKCEEGLPEWLATFADMMTLLMCFFVMLLSFSQLDPAKFKEVAGTLENAFGILRDKPAYDIPKGVTAVFKLFEGDDPTRDLARALQSVARKHSKAQGKGTMDIEVFEDYRGLVLRIGESGMFDPGKAELKPFVWPLLDDLAILAKEIPSEIDVEAHTDSTPVHTARFASNWDLSAARAVATVEYFMKSGHVAPERLRAIGRGDSVPIVPNTTERGRARNRRVEIVFTKRVKPKK